MTTPTLPSPRRGSLRRRILAWTFFPAALILAGVAVAMYFAYQNITEELLVDRDKELARLRAGELANSLSEYSRGLAAVARDLGLAETSSAAQQAVLAAARNRLIYFDGGTFILNNLGRVIAAEPARSDIMGLDWSTRPYFRPLIGGTSEAVFSDIEADGPQGARVIAIAVPISNPRNEFLGALVGMFRLGADTISPFYGTILRLRLERNGEAYVIDQRGNLIYASDPDLIGTSFSGHAVASLALTGEVGAVRTQAPDGREVLASFGPMPGATWRLVIEEDWEALTRSSTVYGQFLLALLALGVLAPVVVVAIGVRRITGPIAELVAASRQVASGNFGRTVAARTGDELEELADQFNRMSAELQASYANLEQRVAARTRELSTLLKIARDVTSTLDVEPLLGVILDQLRSVMDYTGAAILTAEGDGLRFLAYRGQPLPAGAEQARLPLTGGVGEQVIMRGQPVIIADIRAPEVAVDQPAGSPQRLRFIVGYMRALLAVPLTVKETPLGLLAVFHSQPGHFTAQQGELALAFAAQAAVAIENARLFKDVQRRGDQFRLLSEVSQRITSILDAAELMKETVQLISQTFGYYHVGIGLVVGDRVVYQAGAGQLWSQRLVRFAPEGLLVNQEGITGWVAGTGQPLLVRDVAQEPRYVWMEGSQTRSELTVPIRAKDQVIGVLDVQSDKLDG
ncbi:MAG: GAF domain-containing protein, partial [Anaerolineales bacterium]|nr:GAF domain-containing protein [Anaerolineales bacterium]